MIENRVRELRIKQGISQTDLARRIGIAEPNLSSIERGRLMPWPKVKRKLARVLKTTQAELFPTQEGGKNGEG